jgi:hypothetical protein
MNIGKIDKGATTGEQTGEFSGDGRTGVVTTFFAQHGTAYHPKAGGLMVSMPIEGNDGNAFAIAPEKSPPALQEGESAFGNFASGAYMVFKNDGTIEVFGNIKHTGNVEQAGTLTNAGGITSNGKNITDHTHPDAQGGTTGTNT